MLAVSGCASPGEPIERKPPVPQAVTDLAATQTANDVVLAFTMPTESVDHRPLKQPPSVEVYRAISSAEGNSSGQELLVATIPSAEVERYVSQGRVRYVDSLRAEDFGAHNSASVIYSVRTRASEKREADQSNVARLTVRPAPDAIEDLQSRVTRSTVVLSWTPPQKTLIGSVPSVGGYRIYRGENAPAAAPTSADSTAPKSPLAKIGESESPGFQDTQFEFGKSYVYSVRSFVGSGADAFESADSNLEMVTPRDTFPPAAPNEVVVVLVPERGETAVHFELSWDVSPETDVAGYNVYRSEQADVAGTRLNTEPLLTPAFRDMNVQPGHRYLYTVTAVDRSGNESPRSEAASGAVPAESHPTP